jgi:hypothetical protein
VAARPTRRPVAAASALPVTQLTTIMNLLRMLINMCTSIKKIKLNVYKKYYVLSINHKMSKTHLCLHDTFLHNLWKLKCFYKKEQRKPLIEKERKKLPTGRYARGRGKPATVFGNEIFRLHTAQNKMLHLLDTIIILSAQTRYIVNKQNDRAESSEWFSKCHIL